MSTGKFVLDKSIILDILLPNRPNERQAKKVFEILKSQGSGYIPVCIIASLEREIRENSQAAVPQLYELLSFLAICKTPSYINFQHALAKLHMENYLVDVSAQAIGAVVLTDDTQFLANSERA